MTSVKKESKNDNKENGNQKDYQILYLEEKCYYGKNCRGFRSGKCPYNHYGLRGTIRSNVKNLPYGFCKFESLDCSKNTRCKRKACAFDHLKGKIKFVNGTDKIKLVETKSTSTDDVCIVIENNNSSSNEIKDSTNIDKKEVDIKQKEIKKKEVDIKQKEIKQKEVDIKQKKIKQKEVDIKQKEIKQKEVDIKQKKIKQKEVDIKQKEIKKKEVFKKDISKIKGKCEKKEIKDLNKVKKSKKSKFGKNKSDIRYGFKNLNLDMKSLSAI